MFDLAIHSLSAHARWSLRAAPGNVARVGELLGTALPLHPMTSVERDGVEAWWLGPDEWLVLVPVDRAFQTRNRLQAPGAPPFSAVEITDRHLALEIVGAGASWVLNSGCPLDLSTSAFPPGACTRTLFGKVEILLRRRVADVETFHLECGRSFMPYVLNRLSTAAGERA